MAQTAIAPMSAGIGDTPPKQIQILPMGRLVGRDGRGPYIVRDIQHARQIVAASHAYVGTGDIPIDYDHQLVQTAKTGIAAPAAGWITRLHARPDGIWGDVQWTERAADHLSHREYRHVSPVVFYDPKSGAVARIHSASLTNTPNLELQAVASQQDQTTMNDETAARIRALLNLDDAADDATVLQAIANLVGMVVRLAGAGAPDAGTDAAACSATTAPHPQVAMMAQRLATSERALHSTSVDTIVGGAMRQGKVTPAMKDWAVACCNADPGNFQALMSVMPVIVAPGALLPNTPPPQDGEERITLRQQIHRNLGLPADAPAKTR